MADKCNTNICKICWLGYTNMVQSMKFGAYVEFP